MIFTQSKNVSLITIYRWNCWSKRYKFERICCERPLLHKLYMKVSSPLDLPAAAEDSAPSKSPARLAVCAEHSSRSLGLVVSLLLLLLLLLSLCCAVIRQQLAALLHRLPTSTARRRTDGVVRTHYSGVLPGRSLTQG